MGELSEHGHFSEDEIRGTASSTTVSQYGFPTMRELFDVLEIDSPQSVYFVFSDNVDGFYSGRTRISEQCGTYISGSNAVVMGYSFYIDGEKCERETSISTKVLPYGVSHYYLNAFESMSLVSGQRLFSFTLENEVECSLGAMFSIGSNLSLQGKEYQNGEIIVYELLDCNASCRFMAISTNHPLKFDSHGAEGINLEEIKEGRIHLSSINKVSHLQLYIGFSDSNDLAVSMVVNAIASDEINRHQERVYDFLMSSYFWSNDIEYSKAVMWARLASQSFLNTEFGSGIWAGFPWFKDIWGRDSFISLPGTCLVNGQFDTARDIIENFASMQNTDLSSVDYGRIPNRVTSKDNILYNTTDGTPWMIRCVLEYINHSGDLSFAKKIYPVVQRFIAGIEKNYLDDDGLMKHRDPDTWMDAKIEGVTPWSPRGSKANDIQALWFEAIMVAKELANIIGEKADVIKFKNMSDKIKASFISAFWDATNNCLADRVSDVGQPDWSIRPNQLMTITIPQGEMLLPSEHAQYIIKNSVNNLLFPWGICSLNQEHAEFHPYHDNHSMYHKDAAYHNGTIWGWNAGFTISALLMFNKTAMAYELSKNLANQILHQGYRGTMSENLDAYQKDSGDLIESGTYSQAWSVAEYARNAYQDYIGYKPELLHNRVIISPKLPRDWHSVVVKLPLGDNNKILLDIKIEDEQTIYNIDIESPVSNISAFITIPSVSGHLWSVEVKLAQPIKIIVSRDGCLAEGLIVRSEKIKCVSYPILDDISFATPNWSIKHDALDKKNYLLHKRSTSVISGKH